MLIQYGEYWINTDAVSVVESRGETGCVVFTVGGKIVNLSESAENVVARLGQRANDSGPHPYTTQRCIRAGCGKTWGKPLYAAYVCGALPTCPHCGKTQSPWEAGT